MTADQNLSHDVMFKCLYADSLKHMAKCLQVEENDKLIADITQGFPDIPLKTEKFYSTDTDYKEFKKLRGDMITIWKAFQKEMAKAVKKSTDCALLLKSIWRISKMSKFDKEFKKIQLSEDQQQKTSYDKHLKVLLAIEEVFKLGAKEKSLLEDHKAQPTEKHLTGISQANGTQTKSKTSINLDKDIDDSDEVQNLDNADIITSVDAKSRLHTELEKSLDNQNAEIINLQAQLRQLQHEKDSLQEKLSSYTQQHQNSTIQNSTDRDSVIDEITTLKKENESLTLRLSMVAGRKLRDNNPAIADLGDINRPGKLCEMFREIYDNSWTDLLDHITDKCNKMEKKAIRRILSALQGVFNYCQEESQRILKKILKIIGYPNDTNTNKKDEHDGIIKSVKDVVKGTTKYRLHSTIKKCKEVEPVKSLLQYGGIHADTFITNCAKLCLFMCVQDPPVFLDFNFQSGDPFNVDILSHFTSSGQIIDYLVWPVMYLNEHGAVLSKGVAQGKQK